MNKSAWKEIQEGILFVVWPLIWAHEYCHYWVARRLGRLARIQGHKTYVNRVNLWQHILIASAPTLPSALFLFLSIFAYRNWGVTTPTKVYLGSVTAIAALVLLSCAGDWWSIVRAFLQPGSLVVRSSAILILSMAPNKMQQRLRTRLEMTGYFVCWPSSRAEALAAVQRHAFDLVVLGAELASPDRERILQALNGGPSTGLLAVLSLKSLKELNQLPAYLEMGVQAGRVAAPDTIRRSGG